VLYSPRFAALLDDPGDDPPCGGWTRIQIEKMDAAFVERVEAAFEAGFESREAAKATVQVGRPGAVDVERAIEAAWQFCSREDFDVPFATAVELVRAHCAGVTAAQVRIGFERRFKNGGADHAA